MKAQDKEQKRLERLVRLLGDFDGAAEPLFIGDIADEYGVTPRTVQRDIGFLRDAGFGFDEVSRGMYRFSPGQSFKRVRLSEDEAALMVFFGNVADEMGGPFAKTFKTLSKKLAGDEYGSAYAVKLSGSPAKKEYPCAGVLERCIEENLKVILRYRKADAEKEYLLHPYKIVYCDGFWYVWGKNEKEKKIVTFRLDRIVSAQATAVYFTVDKDAERILAEGVNVWMAGVRTMRVLLHVAPKAARYIEEKVYFPLQRVAEKHADGSLTVESYISHERELLPTVFRWLPYVRIVEPQSLADKAQAVLAQYLKQGERENFFEV